MNSGYPGGVILWFAVTIRCAGGSTYCGSFSNAMKPCQSYFSSHPGTGTRPMASLSARRTGTRAGATNPTWPSRSAYTMFWCGAVKSRAAATMPAPFFAASSSKPARATVLSSVSAAQARASTRSFGSASAAPFTTSEITGPWRVERTRMRRSSSFTRITSSRTSNLAVPCGVT
jgi:hypothetical protein